MKMIEALREGLDELDEAVAVTQEAYEEAIATRKDWFISRQAMLTAGRMAGMKIERD